MIATTAFRLRRRRLGSALALLALAALVSSIPRVARAGPESETIVRVRPGTTLVEVEGLAASFGARVRRGLAASGLYLLDFGAAGATAETTGRLAASPLVLASFPNRRLQALRPFSRATEVPPSPAVITPRTRPLYRDFQWYLDRIHFDQAGVPPLSGPMVAVLDTGVDYTHPTLRGRVIKGHDYVGDDDDPMDENGHGTAVASLIAAGSAAPGTRALMQGISPGSRILGVRVLDNTGSATVFSLAEALTATREHQGVKIIVMAWDITFWPSSGEYETLRALIEETVSTFQILVVASAGNSFDQSIFQNAPYGVQPLYFPGCVPASLTVGATSREDSRTYAGNYDVYALNDNIYDVSYIDLVAPGLGILAAREGGQVAGRDGTDMAAAIVAGAAARVISARPLLTPAAVIALLRQKGELVDESDGFPSSEVRLDLARALGKSLTGFTGIVYNAETSHPLSGVRVEAVRYGQVAATAVSRRSGSFTLTGLLGDASYDLRFSKVGFLGRLETSWPTWGGKILALRRPFFLVPRRDDGTWHLVVSWRTTMPGYYEAKRNLPTPPSWWPVPWYATAGAFYTPVLRCDWVEVGPDNRGDQGAWYHALLTSKSRWSAAPVHTYVVPEIHDTVIDRLYLRLVNPDQAHVEYGSFQGMDLKAEIFKGEQLMAVVRADDATGGGGYWLVADLVGPGTLTVLNRLAASPDEP